MKLPIGPIRVRSVDEAILRKLRQRAARRGRSVNAEICHILRDAVKDEGHAKTGLGTEIAALFKGVGLKRPIRELRGFKIKPAKIR